MEPTHQLIYVLRGSALEIKKKKLGMADGSKDL
jgi:hypothetical protein